MPSDQVPFAIKLPSDLHLLTLARTFVETICQKLICDDCFCGAIQLATHEALQNIIRHAHGGRCDAVFEIQVVPLNEGVEIRLLDEGERFDVTNVPHLDPAEMRIGGRGVFLMRRLMDEVVSEPRRPHGNILRLVKHYRPIQRRLYA
jgi:anti-sigma regulatory factor (Ser/Thr protein kinase)